MQTVSPDAKGRVNLGKFLTQGETWVVEQVDPGVIRLNRLVHPKEGLDDGGPSPVTDGFQSWSDLADHLDRIAVVASPDGKDAVDLLLEERRRRNRVLEGGR
jgi:hypothetical protein